MADTSVFYTSKLFYLHILHVSAASLYSVALFFSSPLELFFPCTEFKMIFGDTQVDGAVKSQPRFG